jgi:kinesin family protein C1
VNFKLVERGGTGRRRREKVLALADLAGSERLNMSGVEGDGKKEAAHINTSLMYLGLMMKAKLTGASGGLSYVPYRNDKLCEYLYPFIEFGQVVWFFGMVARGSS